MNRQEIDQRFEENFLLGFRGSKVGENRSRGTRIVEGPTTQRDEDFHIRIVCLQGSNSLIKVFIPVIGWQDLICFRVDRGKRKVDVTVDAKWDLFGPEPMAGAPSGPSFIVAHHSRQISVF